MVDVYVIFFGTVGVCHAHSNCAEKNDTYIDHKLKYYINLKNYINRLSLMHMALFLFVHIYNIYVRLKIMPACKLYI